MSIFALVFGFISGFLFRQWFTVQRRIVYTHDAVDETMTHIKDIIAPARQRIISPSQNKNLLKDLESDDI